MIDATSLAPADHHAIIDAVEDYLAEDHITTVRLDGPVLDTQPLPDGFALLAANLDVLVEGRGVRFYVGPI